MRVPLIAAGVTALVFLAVNIPTFGVVDPSAVYLSAALIAVLAFVAAWAVARVASRIPVPVALVLFLIAAVNLYFIGYSIAFATGATFLLGAEATIRYVISAVFIAAAVASMVGRWWPKEVRA